MGEGWDFGPGNINDFDYNPVLSAGSGIDWGSVGNWAGNLLNLGANVWAKEQLFQQQVQGQAYLEGQRIANQNALMSQGLGLNMGTLLLLGGAVVVVMLLKD